MIFSGRYEIFQNWSVLGVVGLNLSFMKMAKSNLDDGPEIGIFSHCKLDIIVLKYPYFD